MLSANEYSLKMAGAITSLLQGPARILLADIDEQTSTDLAPFGKQGGYEVVSATGGRDAYRLLKADADFKAVILNIAIPQLSGIEIVRFMKTEKRLMRIPIVMICNDYGLKHVSESFAAGALAVLPKPFTPVQLHRTIRMVLNSQQGNSALQTEKNLAAA
jgi:DNA-binding response OmpR family regulator